MIDGQLLNLLFLSFVVFADIEEDKTTFLDEGCAKYDCFGNSISDCSFSSLNGDDLFSPFPLDESARKQINMNIETI